MGKRRVLNGVKGGVVDVVKNKTKPTVIVEWDTSSDVEGKAGAAIKSK